MSKYMLFSVRGICAGVDRNGRQVTPQSIADFLQKQLEPFATNIYVEPTDNNWSSQDGVTIEIAEQEGAVS